MKLSCLNRPEIKLQPNGRSISYLQFSYFPLFPIPIYKILPPKCEKQNNMFILIILCLTDHTDLKVGIIVHVSSWLSWPTFNPLKMIADHLALTLLSSEGRHRFSF